VGRQLTWFLRAVADLPWSQQLIRAHFDSGFLAQLSPADINSALEEGLPTLDASVPSSGASLTGVLWQDPARDPDSLLAVASFGRVQLAVNIAADGAGLISGLRISPYQPPPASWAQVDRDLAALAPDASLRAVPVENSATSAGLGFHAAGRYSLISPASLVLRWIRVAGMGKAMTSGSSSGARRFIPSP
jgi:hypothetical protein